MLEFLFILLFLCCFLGELGKAAQKPPRKPPTRGEGRGWRSGQIRAQRQFKKWTGFSFYIHPKKWIKF